MLVAFLFFVWLEKEDIKMKKLTTLRLALEVGAVIVSILIDRQNDLEIESKVQKRLAEKSKEEK
jgi:hypothetical protein